MPRGIFNWTYHDVVDFLKENGFLLNHSRGSHFYFVKEYKGKLWQVCVPFHGSTAFKPRTLKGMILQSGIPQKEWMNYFK